jgi:glycosyltransferase involved in cell wall biosynthesis
MLSALNQANVVAIVAKMVSNAKTRLVVSERNTLSVEKISKTDLRSRVMYKLIPVLYKRADMIVAVSDGVNQDLVDVLKIPVNRVQTIYNPFDLEHIKSMAIEDVDQNWFQPGQPPVILSIGRLVEQKGFFDLVRAFSKVVKKVKARLVIIGDGPLRSEIRALTKSHGLTDDDVHLEPFTKNPYKFLARSRLYVLSSHWEGLPGSLIEALACGVPVVSTNCHSGPNEILEGGKWGMLVPVGDADALAASIIDGIVNPPSRYPDGKQRAKDFDLDKSVSRYLQLLDSEAAVSANLL